MPEPTRRSAATPAPRRRKATAVVLAGVVFGMVGLSFASVPLYRLFCQVTGYGGTPRIDAEAKAGNGESAGGRFVTVRFDANVDPRLPWRFRPVQRQMRVRLDEPQLAHFEARNTGSRPIVGTATFNVTPAKAGPYFVKVQCFCFDEQRLEAGQMADMPVSFFVDPAILEDANARDVTTITLSYTFFRAEEDAAPATIEAQTRGPASGES